MLPARRLPADGIEAWGYEGLVGKDEDSTYTGGTSLRWLKLKRPDARDQLATRRR